MSSIRPVLIITLLSVMCISCGFHLRGSTPKAESALSRLYLVETRSSPVADELKYILEINETELVSERSLADYTLILDDYNTEQTVMSISASTGKAEEYQLQLTIRMTVSDNEYSEVINNQLIRITRDYAFDDTAVLGSVTERDVLINEMTKLAATQIVQILGALTD